MPGTSINRQCNSFRHAFSVASVRNVLLADTMMAKLRQPKRQVTTGMLGQSSAMSGWDRYDLMCGVYLLLVLIAFALTGIALARGDLPSEKIPHQIIGN